MSLVYKYKHLCQLVLSLFLFLTREEGHRRRPHEPEVVAMGDEEASGEEVQLYNNLLAIF